MGADTNSDSLGKAGSAINSLYNMAQNGIAYQFWGQWPRLHAVFQHTISGKCCTLRISNVRMARSAVIQVQAKLPSSKPPAAQDPTKPNGITADPKPVAPVSPDLQKRADKLAERSRRILSNRFAVALAGFTNTVPTFSQIDTLRSNLSVSREVLPDVRLGILEDQEQVIVFDTDNRWTRLTSKLTAGGGYSAESKESGTLTFSGENLIFQIPDSLSPKETETANYTGSSEVQNANAEWGLNWTHTLKSGAQVNYGPHLSGDFHQDENQRFGNITGPILRDHEIGWEPSFSYSYSPAQIGTSGPVENLFGLTGSTGIRDRWFRITPATGNVYPPNNNGTVLLAFLDVAPGYHYQPAKPSGIGGFEFSADANLQRSLPAGDFTFTEVQVSVKATLYFGGGAFPTDYFVRFRKGMGTSTGVTPLFALFRLGGTENTRGVEQGEQIGREIAFEQSEAGLSARRIVSWFRPPPKPAKPEQPPKKSPIDLSKIYLKSFHDRGRVAGNLSFGDLFAFNHAAKGYGVAVELAGISAGNRRISLSEPEHRVRTVTRFDAAPQRCAYYQGIH